MTSAILSGGVALLILAVFISAIRISYAIERATKPKPCFPRYTNIVSSALGMGVAPTDHDTLALVRRLRWRMLIVGLLFGVMALNAYGFDT